MASVVPAGHALLQKCAGLRPSISFTVYSGGGTRSHQALPADNEIGALNAFHPYGLLFLLHNGPGA